MKSTTKQNKSFLATNKNISNVLLFGLVLKKGEKILITKICLVKNKEGKKLSFWMLRLG
jgi:hypothetical protein